MRNQRLVLAIGGVIQLAPELPATPYEEVEERMRERAFAEATERHRKQWLQELRRTPALVAGAIAFGSTRSSHERS